MKIYGNAKSDGFGVYVGVLGALALVGGAALSYLGAVALIIVPASVFFMWRMVKTVSAWNVMSDSPVTFVDTRKTVKVQAIRFPMPATSDVAVAAKSNLWIPADVGNLPAHVDMPVVGAVKSNTLVA